MVYNEIKIQHIFHTRLGLKASMTSPCMAAATVVTTIHIGIWTRESKVRAHPIPCNQSEEEVNHK